MDMIGVHERPVVMRQFPPVSNIDVATMASEIRHDGVMRLAWLKRTSIASYKHVVMIWPRHINNALQEVVRNSVLISN